MSENVVVKNADGEAEVYENVSGVELVTEDGGTATFIHEAEIRYANLPDKPNFAPVATEGTFASLKEKPFYDIPIPLEEQEFAFVNDPDEIPELYYSSLDDIPELFTGERYIVNWDGKEYICVRIEEVEGSSLDDDVCLLGNTTLFLNSGWGVNTGEPFLLFRNVEGSGSIMTLDTSATHTVSITPVNEAKKLDKKYLPDDIGGSISTETVIYEEQTLEFSLNSFYGAYHTSLVPSPFQLVEGQEYIVVWDGTENAKTAFAFTNPADSTNCVAVGNPLVTGGAANDDVFAIVYDSTNNVVHFFSTETNETHTVRIYQKTELQVLPEVTESDNGKVLGVVGGKWEKIENSNSIPEFDLTAMGLPSIPLDGTTVSVECDTTALREAAAKGLVKIKGVIAGYGLTFENIVSCCYIPLADTYNGSSILTMTASAVIPYVVQINVSATAISAQSTQLATAATATT